MRSGLFADLVHLSDLENVPVALGVVCADGTLRYANRSLRTVLEAFGADSAEIVSDSEPVVMPRWPSPAATRPGHPISDIRVTWLDGEGADSLGIVSVPQDTRLAEAERNLFRSLLGRLEHEKERVSLEIHDGVAQSIANAIHHVQSLEAAPPGEQRTRIGKVLWLLRQAVNECRALGHRLRPVSLESLGFAKVLRFDLADLALAGVRTTLDFDATGLPAEAETTLYRIASEALLNIRKHADAKSLAVRVSTSDQCVAMMVSDDGAGFDPALVGPTASEDGGLGLIAMRARARMLGGTFHLVSVPGQGTTVSVTIPLSGPGTHHLLR